MSDLDLITSDPAEIKADVIAQVESRIGEKLWPGDERYAYTLAIVDVLVAYCRKANDEASQRYLSRARGFKLDAIGARVGCERLGPTAARTVIRFMPVQPAPTKNVVVPKGTRVTADSVTYFATDSLAVLQPGDPYVEVPATCLTSGTEGNAYQAGDLMILVDLIPYVAAVNNISAAEGGDDGEPYDSDGDDHYRERIRLAIESRSTAGARGAYEYYARSADPSIGDVRVVSEQPGEVTVRPLLVGGGTPDAELLGKVLDVLDGDTVRPMTDLVKAAAPTEVEYDIDIVYYVTAEDEEDVVKTVEGPNGAIERYVAWQSEALGRDINPDKLRTLIFAPSWADGLKGALRMDITAPTYRQLGDDKVAKWSGEISVEHRVVDE